MWYLILFSRKNETRQEIALEKRKKVRAEHLARCKMLQDNHRLLIGGPCPVADIDDPKQWPEKGGFSGGMIIAKFDSLKEALKWANEDPYVTSGVFDGPVIVKPWYQTVGIGVEFGRGI